jgi:hypothetical protein
VGAVWFSVVGDLVTHAGAKREDAAILEFCVELAVDTK